MAKSVDCRVLLKNKQCFFLSESACQSSLKENTTITLFRAMYHVFTNMKHQISYREIFFTTNNREGQQFLESYTELLEPNWIPSSATSAVICRLVLIFL